MPAWAGRVVAALFVLACTAVLAGNSPREARAANGFPVYATIATTGAVKLHSKPGQHRAVVTTLAPGTEVKVLDGPSGSGWYKVDAVDLKAKSGWVRSDELHFDRYVRAASDLNLFDGPGHGNARVAHVRHGIVMRVIGPGKGDYLLVRYGDATGYVFVPTVTASRGPATDPHGERWVDVDRSTHEVQLMIGSTVVDTFDASLGRDRGDGFFATASGTYSIYSKVAGLSYTPYANAYIEYWAGFDPNRDNGFHAWTMDANGYVIPGGDGPTGGCVATNPQDAAVIFDFVDIGTRVEIHW
jgi:L,D-transpeptidase catalytic domain/Bacterial SH3 domain